MTKTYPLSPDKFAEVCSQLGLGAATTGTFKPPGHDEITLGYAYLNCSLQVTVLHEAWYENADMIFGKLDPYFA